MKINLARKFIAMFFTFCMMVSLVPVSVLAAENDTNITEINLENVSNELWSYKEMPFATVDTSSNYTIESQKWYSVGAGEITPSSTSRTPKAGEEYSFIITLKANDGYIFPIKSESNVFYDGTLKVDGTQQDDASVNVTSEGKMLTATLFTFTKVKGITDPSDKIIDTTVRNKIIEGENSSWIQNTDETLTFRADGDFSKFIGIKIDNSWIDSENYTAAPSSTVVTLKNEYLKTLSEGTHNITFIFKGNKCSTNFEVKKAAEKIKENSKKPTAEEKEKYSEKSSSPKTGDNSNMLLWISLLSASFMEMLEMIVYGIKKELISL